MKTILVLWLLVFRFSVTGFSQDFLDDFAIKNTQFFKLNEKVRSFTENTYQFYPFNGVYKDSLFSNTERYNFDKKGRLTLQQNISVSGNDSIVYEYDETGKNITSYWYNEFKRLLVTRKFTLTDFGKIQQYLSSNSNGETLHIYIYDSNQNLLKTEESKANDARYGSIIRMTYNKNGSIATANFLDKTNRIYSSREYTYGERTRTVELYNGNSRTRFVSTYDKNGTEIENKEFDAAGTLISASTSKYNNENNVSETIITKFAASGVLWNTILIRYQYDRFNNWIRYESTDKYSRLVKYRTIVYF